MTIAVLGGYGELGQVACRWLHAWQSEIVRVGGRDLTAAQSFAEREGGDFKLVAWTRLIQPLFAGLFAGLRSF